MLTHGSEILRVRPNSTLPTLTGLFTHFCLLHSVTNILAAHRLSKIDHLLLRNSRQLLHATGDVARHTPIDISRAILTLAYLNDPTDNRHYLSSVTW